MLLFEIFKFMIPNDLFQVFFLLVIMSIGFWNYLSIRKNANSKNWLANWENDTASDSSDDLDSEHGSVLDISQAVATKAERWAEMIPGIMLIMGLLGTFMGLGVALNKASYILSNAHSTDFSYLMENLMNMMEGLGTKFKTSAWGIMGFLIYKSWISINGFDERRLRWAIGKMKQETIKRREGLQQSENENYNKMKDLLQEMINHVVGQEKFYQNLEESIGVMSKNTEKMEKNTFIMQKDYKAFIDSTAGNIEGISVASTSLSGSAENFTQASKDFSNTVDSFSAKISDEINKTLGYFADNLSETTTNFSNVLDKRIEDYTNLTKNAIEQYGKLFEVINNLSITIEAQNEINNNLVASVKDSIESLESTYKSTNKELVENVTGSLDNSNNLLQNKFEQIDKELAIVSEKVIVAFNKFKNDFNSLVSSSLQKYTDTANSNKALLSNIYANNTNILNNLQGNKNSQLIEKQTNILTEIKKIFSENEKEIKGLIKVYDKEQIAFLQELNAAVKNITQILKQHTKEEG
jgi:hypothetical protein